MNPNLVIGAIAHATSTAVIKTSQSNTNNMNEQAVLQAGPELKANIAAAIAADPIVQNVTNTEPHFWMKRTWWSQLGSLLGGLSIAAGPIIEYFKTHTTDTGQASISLFGLAMACWSGYSAFSAGRATKPLFSGTGNGETLPGNRGK